jgi:hypothetical protein
MEFLGFQISDEPFENIEYSPPALVVLTGTQAKAKVIDQPQKHELSENDIQALMAKANKKDQLALRIRQTQIRKFELVRSEEALVDLNESPLLFVDSSDPPFWKKGQYGEFLTAITSGSMGTHWQGIKTSGKHQNSEMVGCMLATFSYTFRHANPDKKPLEGVPPETTVKDHAVSGAINLLFDTNKKQYKEHLKGPNGGQTGQVHTEATLLCQLVAFLEWTIEKLNKKKVKPEAWKAEAWKYKVDLTMEFDAKNLDIDVALYIEKGGLCPACATTVEQTQYMLNNLVGNAVVRLA